MNHRIVAVDQPERAISVYLIRSLPFQFQGREADQFLACRIEPFHLPCGLHFRLSRRAGTAQKLRKALVAWLS
jgi:hypothetical protein